MAAIPTIAEVIDRVAAGTVTRAQAMVWIQRLIGEAVDDACALDVFAGQAMQTLMADRKFQQDAKNNGGDVRQAVADEAYAQARAMKNARN